MSAASPVTAAKQLALAAATVEVLDAMDEARIRVVMLKGAAIATRLYDNPYERLAGDVDLLVAPSQARAAEQVLERLGFRDLLPGAREHERTTHAMTFRRGGAIPAFVDLHTALYWSSHDPEALWDVFSRATTFINIGNRSAEVLDDAAQALVIATHAVQHGNLAKPRADLLRALARYDTDTWVNAAAMARRLGAEAVLAAGLRLSDRGSTVAERLALSDDSSAEIRLRIAGAPPIAAGVMRFAQTGSFRQRVLLVLGELVPTPSWMRVSYRFADRGQTALVLAYLYRPVWLARRLPAGLRAWRRATRSP